MGIKSTVAGMLGRIQTRRIHAQSLKAIYFQEKTRKFLIQKARNTAFGKDHHFEGIQSYEDFCKHIPIRNYEQQRSYFERIVDGEADVLWPGKPLYLAKTSGTTSGAKYIPITKESIRRQVASARDALLLYVAETGKGKFFDGKMMFLSGSPEIDTNSKGMRIGRLSGIVNHFVPAALTANRVPTYETNIIEEWEKKVASIVEEVHHEDLRLISGIPPWVQMFFEQLEDQTGKTPMESWPNLSLYVHGGVDFSPYRPIFDAYFGGKVDVIETYPASEGFIAYQNSQQVDDLLLLTNNGIFYEFIPLDQYGQEDAPRLSLKDVELGKQYALVLSTNAGLWAYDIGDTIKFTSLNPYKIRVSGRVKHFISAFGEHVISEEVNRAILEATQATRSSFQEFTVAPSITTEKGHSCHEWYIEFVNPPADLPAFVDFLDKSLCQQNAYYKDLREGNILQQAKVYVLERNASRKYMKSIGKLGGQNKFPRLSNDRKIVDFLHSFIES